MKIRPPINISDVGYTTTKWDQNPWWSPDGHSVNLVDEIGSMVLVQYPESTDNPVRKDGPFAGTRPPSAYWGKRVVVVNIPKAVETTYGANGWRFNSGSNPGKRLYLQSADMGWWQDAFRIPYLEFNVDNRARTRFLNKLADRSGKDLVSLGVIAGEFRETAGMAADLASGLIDAVKGLSKTLGKPAGLVARVLHAYQDGGGRSAALQLLGNDVGLLDSIVKGWLVLQFGLIPLSYDLVDATAYLNAYMEFGEPLHLNVTVKAGVSEEGEGTVTFIPWDASSGVYGLNGLFKSKVSVHYACIYQIPTRANYSQELGLYNPAVVAWELCRFSWMADYVLEVGPWLRSLMASQDCVFVEGTRSETRKAYLDKLESRPPSGASFVRDPSAGRLTAVVDYFARTLVSGGVFPSFLPGIHNQLDVTRLANVVSALTTLVGARSRVGPPII